jgi:hypothetical protein
MFSEDFVAITDPLSQLPDENHTLLRRQVHTSNTSNCEPQWNVRKAVTLISYPQYAGSLLGVRRDAE